MREMKAGRSKRSIMVFAKRNWHLFAWTRGMARANDSTPSYGVTARWRTPQGWTHVRLILWQENRTSKSSIRPPRPGHRMRVRRTMTLLELAKWNTTPGTRDRIGMKSYVRVKVGPGGHEEPVDSV